MRKHLNGMAIILAALVLTSCLPAQLRTTSRGNGPATNVHAPGIQLAASGAGGKRSADADQAARRLRRAVSEFNTDAVHLPDVLPDFSFQLKNYAKAIEYTDKLVALGIKRTSRSEFRRFRRACNSSRRRFDPKAADAHDQLVKQRDAALQGIKLLPDLKKANPKMTDDQVKARSAIAALEGAAGAADVQLKDYPAAEKPLGVQLALRIRNDPVASYRLGLAYLQATPAQSLDGFWALARAVDLKIPDTDKVKDYLRKTIVNYQQPNCDTLIDAQLNELLQLAANAPDRPATYSIPSAADIQKVAQASTIITVIGDLSGGGDKAKLTWLAICGAEFRK